MNKYQRLAVIWALFIPVFYFAATLLGYFIFWALGYEENESVFSGPVIDRFIISLPVAALMLTPCVQAIRYGFAAKRTGSKRALFPTVAGALAASYIFFGTLISLLGIN